VNRSDLVVSGRVLRTRDDRLTLRWHPRTVTVCAVLVIVTLALIVLTLTTGDYPVPLRSVVDSLLGSGSGTESFVVLGLRLPRLTAGLLIGAALGMSGAVFQSLSRNALGSPDIIGFTSGAAAGAVLQILLFHGGQDAIALASILGGLGTAMIVYLLSSRRGHVAGYRLVLVGIGVSAVLGSLITYLMTRADLTEAQNAQVWLIGSLNGIGWSVVLPLAIALAVLIPITLVAGRTLRWLEMGDDTARALGVPVERTRLLLVIVGTALAASATAAAGPIAFVALAAPQLVRRLTGGSGAQLAPAAAMGALLLIAGDFGAQRLAGSSELPVGVVTGLLGGGYLCWLLASMWRAGRA
jgi:iron complex transport system permease protein